MQMHIINMEIYQPTKGLSSKSHRALCCCSGSSVRWISEICVLPTHSYVEKLLDLNTYRQ